MHTFEDLLEEQKKITGYSQNYFEVEDLDGAEPTALAETLDTAVADGLLRRHTVTTTVEESGEITMQVEVSYEFTEEGEERHVKWLVDGLSPLAQDTLSMIRSDSARYWMLMGPMGMYEEIGVTLTEMRAAYRELVAVNVFQKYGSRYVFTSRGEAARDLVKRSLQTV